MSADVAGSVNVEARICRMRSKWSWASMGSSITQLKSRFTDPRKIE
jgi:hypothetical protein